MRPQAQAFALEIDAQAVGSERQFQLATIVRLFPHNLIYVMMGRLEAS